MKKINERDQEIKLKKEPSTGNPHGQVGIGRDSGIAKLIAELIDSIKKGSETTNKLTKKIKTLNWILVIITTAGLILYGISLYLQYFRN